MFRNLLLTLLVATAALAQTAAPPPRKIQVLIITGRDDHDWRGATAAMRSSWTPPASLKFEP
jgi:hypothetical protein